MNHGKQIDEKNLNFLNEEVSNYINDMEDIENEETYGNNNILIKENHNSFRSNNSKNFEIIHHKAEIEEKNYLNFKLNELSNELVKKMTKIKLLEEKLSNQNHLIENLKKSRQIVPNEKTLNFEELKMDLSFKSKKVKEIESENNLMKNKIEKLNETIQNQEKILNEFQSLVTTCNQKFLAVEITSQNENEQLKQQIEKLNDQLYQYSLKEIRLENESKELLMEKENHRRIFEEKSQELKSQEENLITSYEKLEKTLKESFEKKQNEIKEEYMKEVTELSKEVQMYTIKYEKMKLENQKLQEKNEEISNLIVVKENEFNEMLEKKNSEKENLMKMLYEVNDEMVLLENKFNTINSELNDNNSMLSNELKVKTERLKVLEEDNVNMKELLDSLQHNYNNISSQLKQKESLFEELKNQHIEVVKEFNSKYNQFEKIESEQNINIELLTDQIENMKRDQESLLQENNELRKFLDKSNDKLNEINVWKNKVLKLEETLKIERNERENYEMMTIQINQKLKENEMKTFAEFSKLKNFVVAKDDEMENLKNNYENKISKLKLKIEELKFCKENLINEMTELKEKSIGIERNNLQQKGRVVDNYNSENYQKEINNYLHLNNETFENNEKDYRENMESLRNIISKIDGKFMDTKFQMANNNNSVNYLSQENVTKYN